MDAAQVEPNENASTGAVDNQKEILSSELKTDIVTTFSENIDFTKASPRDTPQSDVEQFEKIFEAWKNHDFSSEAQSIDSKKELEVALKNQLLSDHNFEEMKTTNELLHKSIDSLHNELNLIAILEQDNKDLKENLKRSESLLREKEKELAVTCKNYEEKLIQEKENQKTQSDKQLKAMEKKLYQKINELQSEIDKNLLEIDSLKLRIVDEERQKEKEITALTVEYEDKLAKVQRMKASAAHNQTPTSSNQEIFRKKLQHLKSEYETETKYLKDQIKGLQCQISGQLNRSSGRQSVSPVTPVPTFAKRPRKF